jgi:hypothetical protein
MLTFNGGTCEQNGSSGVIDVYQKQAVIYEAAAILTNFQVEFAACPFNSCPVSSPHGTSVNVGKPIAGAIGMTFNYRGLTIDNQNCTNAAQMGLRIKPAS